MSQGIVTTASRGSPDRDEQVSPSDLALDARDGVHGFSHTRHEQGIAEGGAGPGSRLKPRRRLGELASDAVGSQLGRHAKDVIQPRAIFTCRNCNAPLLELGERCGCNGVRKFRENGEKHPPAYLSARPLDARERATRRIVELDAEQEGTGYGSRVRKRQTLACSIESRQCRLNESVSRSRLLYNLRSRRDPAIRRAAGGLRGSPRSHYD
jgi:hypothetical protein